MHTGINSSHRSLDAGKVFLIVPLSLKAPCYELVRFLRGTVNSIVSILSVEKKVDCRQFG